MVPLRSTECGQPWQQTYGPGSPAFERQVAQVLATAGITATVRTSTFGETEGCGEFHIAALDVLVTAQARDLADQNALGVLAARIDTAVRQIHEQARVAPNLGNFAIVFESGGATCRWDAGSKVCRT
jgi:hypothetical protein